MSDICDHWKKSTNIDGGACHLKVIPVLCSFGVCVRCGDNTKKGVWPPQDTTGLASDFFPITPCGNCGDKTNIAEVRSSPAAMERMLAGE
jgi:hypothetical protein